MENLNNWKAILGDMNQWDQAAWDEWYALGEEWYYKYKADDQLFYEHMGGGTLEEVDTRFIAAWDYYESHDKSNSELFVPLIIMAILGAAEDDSSGFVPGGTQIHWGKQGKHIPGHNNYIPGRSIITHSNPQSLIDDFAGTGSPLRGTSGQPGFKEWVDFGQEI